MKTKTSSLRVVSKNNELKAIKKLPLIKPTIKISHIDPKEHIASAEQTKTYELTDKNYYSEAELSQFHKIIVDKLEQAKKDHVLLKNTLCSADNEDTHTSTTFKSIEDISTIEKQEETGQLVLRQKKFIQDLEKALVRIENKTYGICRVTGKLIPKQRLLCVPQATFCVDAKQMQQSN